MTWKSTHRIDVYLVGPPPSTTVGEVPLLISLLPSEKRPRDPSSRWRRTSGEYKFFFSKGKLTKVKKKNFWETRKRSRPTTPWSCLHSQCRWAGSFLGWTTQGHPPPSWNHSRYTRVTNTSGLSPPFLPEKRRRRKAGCTQVVDNKEKSAERELFSRRFGWVGWPWRRGPAGGRKWFFFFSCFLSFSHHSLLTFFKVDVAHWLREVDARPKEKLLLLPPPLQLDSD